MNEDRKFKYASEKRSKSYYSNVFAAHFKRWKTPTKEQLDELALELLEWSDESDSIVIHDFYLEKNIPPSTFAEWVKKHPALRYALDIARLKIGSKRETLAAHFLIHPVVTKNQTFYDPELSEHIKSLKEEEQRPASYRINVDVMADGKPLLIQERKIANDDI